MSACGLLIYASCPKDASTFFKKLIKLKDKEEFDFTNDSVRIFIKYNVKEESIIRIYIHKEV